MINPEIGPKESEESNPETETIELVEATGLAKELLESGETLKPYSSWMGIGVNEKAYPDEMVKDYIRWASKKSEKFLLVIADDIQTYNLVPFSKKGWEEIRNVEDFRELADERKKRIQEWLQKEGISNVDVKRWQEIMDELGEKDSFFVDYVSQLFDHVRQHDPELNEAITEIAPRQIPGLFKKMIKEGKGGEDLKFGKFAVSLYGQAEVFLTWFLAVKGGYPIKIGHEGEKIYDKITSDILTGKYGEQLAESNAKFGSVYLKRK